MAGKTSRRKLVGTVTTGRVKSRAEMVRREDLTAGVLWVHNGRGYVQVSPLAKEAVGLKFGSFVPCTRLAKHVTKAAKKVAKK